jgi:hypothetical protein
MTQDEIIEMAKEAFIKRGFWPNEVMWKCWLDAWILSAQHEREAVIDLVDSYAKNNTDLADAIRARGQE